MSFELNTDLEDTLDDSQIQTRCVQIPLCRFRDLSFAETMLVESACRSDRHFFIRSYTEPAMIAPDRLLGLRTPVGKSLLHYALHGSSMFDLYC